MKDLLQSAWTIGIGTGIISGIIIYFFSNFIAKRRNNSEHIAQINQANKKIISILTPFIANNGLPNIEIINSVIFSVARQTLLNPNELFSVKVLCEELIREVMENIYISVEKKIEYSKELKEYLESIKINEKTCYNEIIQQFQNIENNNKNKYQKNFSIVISIMTSMFMLIMTMSLIRSNTLAFDELFMSNDKISFLLIPLVIAMIMSILLVISFLLSKTKNLKEISDNKEKDTKIKEKTIHDILNN